MHSGDPSSAPAGDTLAVSSASVADYPSKMHLDRGVGLISTGADSNNTIMDLDRGDGPSASEQIVSHLQSDSVNVGSEIGELLEGGLGDAERIGAQLASLSAELGLLAGLDDTDRLHDLLDVPKVKPASISSRSSSSSGTSGIRVRAHRKLRASRRRTIAKLKESGRRRACATASSRRVAERADAASDVSDVGADSDDEDGWRTEYSSESSSVKEGAAADSYDCNQYEQKMQEAEAPPMGQFLLPLLSSETPSTPADTGFLIRHEDILQLLASAEESARSEKSPVRVTPEEDSSQAEEQQQQQMNDSEPKQSAVSLLSPEEEADVLSFVCEAERQLTGLYRMIEVDARLLATYRIWSDASALMYALLIISNIEVDCEKWLYRARLSCQCRLCVSRAHSSEELAEHVQRVVIALAKGEKTMRDALKMIDVLHLRQKEKPLLHAPLWDIEKLVLSDHAYEIVEQCQQQLMDRCELTREMCRVGCLCRVRQGEPLTVLECFYDMLIRFQDTFCIGLRVEMLTADGGHSPELDRATRELSVQLRPIQVCSTAATLRNVAAANVRNVDTSVRCHCTNPPMLNNEDRKRIIQSSMYLLKEVVFTMGCQLSQQASGAPGQPAETADAGTMATECEAAASTTAASPHQRVEKACVAAEREEPTRAEGGAAAAGDDCAKSDEFVDAELFSDDDEWEDSESERWSCASLDTPSQLLAAAAEFTDPVPQLMCGTVRRLCRSIASIESLMDMVLKNCDSSCTKDVPLCSSRVKLDDVVEKLDRKLMAMYRWLPDMSRKQHHMYRKQKKLAQVCMKLVGSRAPSPPPPGSPPPVPPESPPAASPRGRSLCPEYHLRRFREVKSKVMHMCDQQMYFHKLHYWLTEHLKLPNEDRSSVHTMRHLRGPASPRARRRTARCRLRPQVRVNRIVHALIANKLRRQTAESKDVSTDATVAESGGDPAAGTDSNTDGVIDKDGGNQARKSKVRFAKGCQGGAVGSKLETAPAEVDLCSGMKDFNNGLADLTLETSNTKPIAAPEVSSDKLTVYPDSTSPPLQDLSPTCSEPLTVYHTCAKSNIRMVAVNKILNRSANMLDKLEKDVSANFDMAPTKTLPVLPTQTNPNNTPPVNEIKSEQNKSKDETSKMETVRENKEENEASTHGLLEQFGDMKLNEAGAKKDPRVHKYVEFGLEIKRAIEECQNIINSCNNYQKVNGDSAQDKSDGEKSDLEKDEVPMSLEQICEAILSLDKNSTDILECMNRNTESKQDANISDAKLAAIVDSIPQILALSKLTEYASVSFEMPEFASVLNSLPEMNSDAQLTPETLKQIRELKINKSRDSLKVTKHTAKRKTGRRVKVSTENDVIGTITLDLDSKEMSDMMKDDKGLQSNMKGKSCKENFRDMLIFASAQAASNKAKCSKHCTNTENSEGVDVREILHLLEVVEEVCANPSKFFENSAKASYSMQEFKQYVEARFNSWKTYLSSKFIQIPPQTLQEGMDTMLGNIFWYIEEMAEKQNQTCPERFPEKLDQELKNESANSKQAELPKGDCPKHGTEKSSDCDYKDKLSEVESLKQIMKYIKESVGSTFDILLMQTSKMTNCQKNSVKSFKFKYMDVIRRCADSEELSNWILLNPEVAANVILEMTGVHPKPTIDTIDFTNLPLEKRLEYFMRQLCEMNKCYMKSLPNNTMTGDDWVVTLFRLEQLENRLKDALTKAINSNPKQTPPTHSQNNVNETREAEIVAGKGLSKIINQANKAKKPTSFQAKQTSAQVKQTNPPNAPTYYTVATSNNQCAAKPPEEPKAPHKNGALLLDKCEGILMSRGEKSLLDSFYKIKSYITSGLPVPESYKKQVVKICSSIDPKLLESEADEALNVKSADKTAKDAPQARAEEKPNSLPEQTRVKPQEKPKEETETSAHCCQAKGKHFAAVESQNPELLAKYSAQALRNAKQSLNAVAFNSIRNSKPPEADVSQRADCTWSSDCVCPACEANCPQAEPVDGPNRPAAKLAAKDSKAPVNTQPKIVPAKVVHKPAPAKTCENVGHQQHICKMGHTTSVPGCANEGSHHQASSAADQPCSCCYCTVFGHAPPMTTPVPRNFNETRERLRSILNRKKQKTGAAATKPAAPSPSTTAQSDTPDASKPAVNPSPPVAQAKPAPAPVAKPAAVRAGPKQAQSQSHLADQMARMMLGDQAAQQVKTAPDKPPPVAARPPARVASRPLSPKSPPYPPRPLTKDEEALEKRLLQEYNQMQQKQLQRALDKRQRGPSGSSRDSSVLSTDSECSNVSGWRDGCVSEDDGYSRPEDTRDLDALLQYIEGPARHVDRGKKKAKKQRQKAKKMESKLLEEQEELSNLVLVRRKVANAARNEVAAAKRRAEETKNALKQHEAKGKKKGKKGRQTVNVALQQLSEEHGHNMEVYRHAQEALRRAESELKESASRLADCEAELEAIQAAAGAAGQPEPPQQPSQPPQQPSQQQAAPRAQPVAVSVQRSYPVQPAAAPPAQPHNTYVQIEPQEGGMVRVRRSPGDGAVALSLGLKQPNANAYNVASAPQPEPPQDASKKQTWESALAHITALATRPAPKPKEKTKKQQPGEARDDKKSEKQRPAEPEQPLSKKQRKMLARQQAEEEEARARQLEAKPKRAKAEPAKKAEPAPKPEPREAKREQKRPKEPTRTEPVADKKKAKEKTDNAGHVTKQPAKPQPAAGAASGRKQHVAPETHLVSDRGPAESPSCSIMEQLSCGVQVADLKLPPGITLTRVPASQTPPAPAIKSVPLWKSNSLAAVPTPPARPQPVINADPSLHSHCVMEPKPIMSAEPSQPAGKSKKAKKKAKKAAQAAAEAHPRAPAPPADRKEPAKMVTLRNPMFHPNLPPVQISPGQPKKPAEQLRVPEPIPMPPAACQATITPTSNGMYTIRNPLMSMVHQQSLLGMSPPPGAVPQNPNYAGGYVAQAAQPPASYQEQPSPAERRYEERQPDCRREEPGARIMNLASFTQKSDECYSLFKQPDEGRGAHYAHEYGYEAYARPNPIVSPNPIGTRPEQRHEPEVKLPEPIGTRARRDDEPPAARAPAPGLYTPFGEERDFRSAIFHTDKSASNGETIPYLQRLRAGARLNNQVTIHHVSESKLHKPEQPPPQPGEDSSSLFRSPYSARSWTPGFLTSPSNSSGSMSSGVEASSHAQFAGFGARTVHPPPASLYDSVPNSSCNSPHGDAYGLFDSAEESIYLAGKDEGGFGAIGRSAVGSQRTVNGLRHNTFYPETCVFAPDCNVELSELDSSERDIESFKRFDYFFEPPKSKPKIELNLHDIASQLKKDK